MAGIRQRLLNRIRRRKKPEVSGASAPGIRRLEDGTVLERCVWVTGEELQALSKCSNHPRLFIHWCTSDPDCALDLPDLRELHLFWAHHVDFIAVAWEMSASDSTPTQAVTAVDAWHRDYGLTWQSLIPDRVVGSPATLLGLSEETLPQVILFDAADRILFHRVGALEPNDRAQLAILLREKCSGQPSRDSE